MGGGGGGILPAITGVTGLQNFLKNPGEMLSHPSIEGLMKMDPLANAAGLNDPSPQLPGVATPPPPPDINGADASKAASTEVAKARRGKASTYLTGATGLTTDPTTTKRTLLGS